MKIVEFTQRRGIFAPMRSWTIRPRPRSFAGAAISGSRPPHFDEGAGADRVVALDPSYRRSGSTHPLRGALVYRTKAVHLSRRNAVCAYTTPLEAGPPSLEPKLISPDTSIESSRPRTRQGLHGDGDLIYEPPAPHLRQPVMRSTPRPPSQSSYVPEPDLMTTDRASTHRERPSKTDRVPTPRTSAASAPSARSA